MGSMSQFSVAVDPNADNNPHSYAIRMVGSAGRVLEIGCAAGHVTEHLVAAGNEVVGIEIDPEAAAAARAHAGRVHVVDLDMTPASTVESGPFDVIVLGDVLEHLRDPEPVLRDLTSLLADDGRLVISVPHVGHVDVRLMLIQGRWRYQPDGLLADSHLRWFTKQSLRELLASVGFVATEVERVIVPVGGSQLPIGHPDGEIVRYCSADPEATTYQFVVEARRSGADALGPIADVAWPSLDGERSAIEAQRDAAAAEAAAQRERADALQHEVDAWRSSRLVRWSRPIRSLSARVRRC